MRIAFDAPVPTHNIVAFDRTDVGTADQTVVDFEFRAVPASGGSAGLGVALLSTAAFGSSGAVDLQAPLFAADQPNFTGSIGVGFGLSADQAIRRPTLAAAVSRCTSTAS